MRGEERMLIRFAVWIYDKLASRPSQVALPALPIERWSRLVRFHRRLAIADDRKWIACLEPLRNESRDSIRSFRYEIAEFGERINARLATRIDLSVRDIFNDLRALREDFAEAEFDYPCKRIRLTTEPIELKGLYLGPFTIELDLARAKQDCIGRYRVIACEPRPSRRNSEVTHPHVCSEQLCEGDGNVAIQRALFDGRLHDFFTIVANVLRTYNPSSPHVSIEKWEGISCQSCGETVDDDERCRCHGCESESCGDCSTCCSMCEYDHCPDCVRQCKGCKEWFCNECLSSCESCSIEMCSNCLNDLSQCEECHERELEETEKLEEELAEANAAGSACDASEAEESSI